MTACCENSETCGANEMKQEDNAKYELITVKAGDGERYPVKGEGVVTGRVRIFRFILFYNKRDALTSCNTVLRLGRVPKPGLR